MKKFARVEKWKTSMPCVAVADVWFESIGISPQEAVDRINSAAESWAKSREEEAVETFRERAAKAICAYCASNMPVQNYLGTWTHRWPGLDREPCYASPIRSLPAGREGKEERENG